MGQLQSEKCDLASARKTWQQARVLAEQAGNPLIEGEALAGLLRLAAEACDDDAIARYDEEIEALSRRFPDTVASKVWYCRGIVAMYRDQWLKAQREFHIYLRKTREVMTGRDQAPHFARAFCMLANLFIQRGHPRRAQRVLEWLKSEYQGKRLPSIDGTIALVQGHLYEREGDLKRAMEWFQKSHTSFMAEHHWYFLLYVHYGYARIARLEKNYKQAYFHLDLIKKATDAPEFAVLRKEMEIESSRLEGDVVDILVDRDRGLVKTKDGGTVDFRKQYLLLDILAALSVASSDEAPQASEKTGGLSKAELIQRVWRENYRAEAHDNKLYYNINRLRKLIEPDVRHPKYLINWKEGYRLAPGLRVRFTRDVSEESGTPKLA